MTTKILTVRIPSPLYSTICQQAAELGISVSALVRRLVEQEHRTCQLAALRIELLTKLDNLTPAASAPSSDQDEMLLLARAIAAHLNPQLVSQVRARLAN